MIIIRVGLVMKIHTGLVATGLRGKFETVRVAVRAESARVRVNLLLRLLPQQLFALLVIDPLNSLHCVLPAGKNIRSESMDQSQYVGWLGMNSTQPAT